MICDEYCYGIVAGNLRFPLQCRRLLIITVMLFGFAKRSHQSYYPRGPHCQVVPELDYAKRVATVLKCMHQQFHFFVSCTQHAPRCSETSSFIVSVSGVCESH